MRKIVSVVTFLVLFINLVIVINSIIIMMMDVMDLSHVFLHSKEGIYLCCLLFVSIYISYIIMKKEISTGNLVYFVIVQMFPFFIVFDWLIKSDKRKSQEGYFFAFTNIPLSFLIPLSMDVVTSRMVIITSCALS